MTDDIDRLRELVHGARQAVVLTGAGISTESGIPDFRSGRGIWAEFDPMEVGHISAFRRDPARVWRFYRLRIDVVRQAAPNAGHVALAALERDGRLARVITQNVDGLHRAAGSDALEVHGALDRVDCLECGARLPIAEAERRMEADAEGVPRCDCGAPLKPGVVLFGEMLPEDVIDEALPAGGVVRPDDRRRVDARGASRGEPAGGGAARRGDAGDREPRPDGVRRDVRSAH